MSFIDHPSNIPTNSYDGDWRGTQSGWGSSSLVPNFDTPLMSKDAAYTSFQRSHPGGSLEGLDGSTSTVVRTSQDVNTVSRSQQGGVLKDDECFIRRRFEEELRKEWRMVFVFRVIWWLMLEMHMNCGMRQALWLRLIEGDVVDDVWLWVDGDEEWLRSEEPDWNSWYDWDLRENDWVNAESALRRRVAQRRYPPLTNRNQRVRSAPPKQRVSAIAWLIASSKEVAELFASHGCTPPTLRTPRIASTLNRIVDEYWDGFPSQTGAWENAFAKAKEDGCICSPTDFRGMRRWFNMIVWLEGKLPILEVGYKSCERCRSLVRSRYKDITSEHTVILHVSLSDAFYNYSFDFPEPQCAKRRLSPTAKRMMDEKLEPLMQEHSLDMRYPPCVNKYPRPLRWYVARLFCEPADQSGSELDELQVPNNIFDGAHDPWVVLGIIAFMMICSPPDDTDPDLHDQEWHSDFSTFLHGSVKCFNMPVFPRLSSTSIGLCRELDRHYDEELSFSKSDVVRDSDWFLSDQDGRQLRLSTAVFVVVAMFLRSIDISVSLCRKCLAICRNSFANTSPSAGFDVMGSGGNDSQGRNVALSLQRSPGANIPEPAGMEAFTTVLHNPGLSKDEVRRRVVAGFVKLREYLDYYGLDASDCLHRSGGDKRPCLEESTLPRHVPANSGSSKLSKSDKTEAIKDKLLDMLRELSLPYERLPWYTLEKDLEKHGFALVNWPAGVLRKRGNRGIHDLSAVEVNKLYEAVTCPDETRRLHIHRCPSTLTVVPVQLADCTPVVASGLKRPMEERDLHPSKRIRFRSMNSKVMQQNRDEASDS